MNTTPRNGRSLTLEAIHDRCQQDGDCLLWTQAVNGGTGSLNRPGYRGGPLV